MSRCRAARAAAVSSAPGSSAIVGSSARARAAAKAAVAVLPPRARRRGALGRLRGASSGCGCDGCGCRLRLELRSGIDLRLGLLVQPPRPPPVRPLPQRASCASVSAHLLRERLARSRAGRYRLVGRHRDAGGLIHHGLRRWLLDHRLLFREQLLREDRLLDQVDHRFRGRLILARHGLLEFRRWPRLSAADASASKTDAAGPPPRPRTRGSPRRRSRSAGCWAGAGPCAPRAAPPGPAAPPPRRAPRQAPAAPARSARSGSGTRSAARGRGSARAIRRCRWSWRRSILRRHRLPLRRCATEAGAPRGWRYTIMPSGPSGAPASTPRASSSQTRRSGMPRTTAASLTE